MHAEWIQKPTDIHKDMMHTGHITYSLHIVTCTETLVLSSDKVRIMWTKIKFRMNIFTLRSSGL